MNISDIGGMIQKEAQCESAVLRQTSILENLQTKRDRLQNQINKTDDAIRALKENPKVAEVLELVSKAM